MLWNLKRSAWLTTWEVEGLLRGRAFELDTEEQVGTEGRLVGERALL